MKAFATSRENTTLKVAYSAITLDWKHYSVWGVKAEHIEKIRFVGCDCTMIVDANVNGEKESYPVELPKNIYEEVETLFSSELDGVVVSSLSKKRQMIFPMGMAILVFIMTMILTYFSCFTEQASGLGWFGTLCGFLTEKFATKGILIGGGAILTLFILVTLKRYFFPKKATTVVFQYGDQFMIFKEEDSV